MRDVDQYLKIQRLYHESIPSPSSPEARPEPLHATREVNTSPEASPLKITGNKILTFSQKSLEGSKEGFVPAAYREESLRLNIAGKLARDIDIDANMLSTSTQAGREDKLSLLIRYGSTEVFFGDFNAPFTEQEFAKLTKNLSGVRLIGNYEKLSFAAIGSTPKGESKNKRLYGNETQGPYGLGAAPVVVDSERVNIDRVPQKKNEDYLIDYQAGTITFRSKIIRSNQVIEVDFEQRQTVYSRSLYGVRTALKLNPALGITYLNEADSTQGAAAIRAALTNPVNPASHTVVGADGKINLGDKIKSDFEIAYSEKNTDLLSPSATVETGKAAKINLAADLDSLKLGGNLKKVGANFLPLGDGAPLQSVYAYGGELAFQPSELINAAVNFSHSEYSRTGAFYATDGKTGSITFNPSPLPRLNYTYYQDDTSNDPVGGEKIARAIIRNSAELNPVFFLLNTSIKATHERWINRHPAFAQTTYKIANFGLSTANLAFLTATGNLELKDTLFPDGKTSLRKTYDTKLSLTPNPQYLLTTATNIVDDSLTGATSVIDFSYRAAPIKELESEGKLTLNSIKEDVGGTSETVSQQVGSLKFSLRPFPQLRVSYLYKPTQNVLIRTNAPLLANITTQGEFTLAPLPNLSAGLIYKINSVYSIDKTDPLLTRQKDRSSSQSNTYTLKLAPIRILSTDFTYIVEEQTTLTLTSVEALTYEERQGKNQKFIAALKSSLSEKVSGSLSYNYERQDRVRDKVNTETALEKNSTTLQGIWYLNDDFGLRPAASWSGDTDYLKGSQTYSFSPGMGVTVKRGDYFRLDADYRLSRAYYGTVQQKENWSLKIKYDVSKNLLFTLRGEQEIGQGPYYKSTEIVSTVEIAI